MSDHVISGLVRRRRELSGELFDLLAKADTLAADIGALDNVIRMFAPGLPLETIPAMRVRPKPDWAFRGEVVRIIFGLLRDAPEALPTAAITKAVHDARGLAGEITFLHMKRVRKCLERQRSRGTIRTVAVNGQVCWLLS